MTETRVVRAAHGRTIAQSRSDVRVASSHWFMYILTGRKVLGDMGEYDQSFFIVWGSLLGTRNFTMTTDSHRYEIQESP